MTKCVLMVDVGGVLARLMPRLPRLTLSKVWPGEEFTGFKLFQPDAYPAYASSKLCKFITTEDSSLQKEKFIKFLT